MQEKDFAAAQAFLLGAKNFWTTAMYRELHATYDSLAKETNPEEAARLLQEDTLYRYFAWLERHLQRMKYTGRYGLIPYHSERRELLEAFEQDPEDEFAPEVDPSLRLPVYYTSTDIHQHSGGLWSDPVAGLVYEHGARTTTPLLGKTHEDLHTRFTERVAAWGPYERILDMGCGFGKSTRPFVRRFSDAAVEAVDLARPCLTVAAGLARGERAGNVKYRQRDARETRFESGSFDLVTSTMLLHEMPASSLKRLFAECHRVLRPGGRMAHLDFYILPDEFRKLLHYGHARRNNEPFMPAIVETDLPATFGELGFTDIVIEPFRESDDVDLDTDDTWRFPWTVISAVKNPEAER